MIGNLSYYKDAKGNYVAQITLGYNKEGKRRYKRFKGKLKKDVVEKVNNFFLYKSEIPAESVDVHYDDYLLGYMKNVKRFVLKPTSFTREMTTVEKHIIPYIGQYKLSELSTDIIQKQLINSLVDKGYSFSTVHKAYVLVNSSLKAALQKEMISKNPCSAVKEPSKKIFKTKEVRFFDDEEIEKFVEEARKNKYKYGLAISTIIYTGMRGGELCALKWEDIDFDNKIITINKNIATYYKYEGKTKKRVVEVQNSLKTNEQRIITLTKSAEMLFREQFSRSKLTKNSDFVVETEKPMSEDIISQSYSIIAENAGIRNPLGVHTLRHTFCSLLIRKNIDIKTISEIVGHKSVNFTYNTYVHLLEKQKAMAIRSLDI